MPLWKGGRCCAARTKQRLRIFHADILDSPYTLHPSVVSVECRVERCRVSPQSVECCRNPGSAPGRKNRFVGGRRFNYSSSRRASSHFRDSLYLAALHYCSNSSLYSHHSSMIQDIFQYLKKPSKYATGTPFLLKFDPSLHKLITPSILSSQQS